MCFTIILQNIRIIFLDISKAAVMDALMFKPRKSVRKIYAGRPRNDVPKEVPTLQNLCIKVLIANINCEFLFLTIQNYVKFCNITL